MTSSNFGEFLTSPAPIVPLFLYQGLGSVDTKSLTSSLFSSMSIVNNPKLVNYFEKKEVK